MKIRRLKIEGFRSLRQVEWTPGDLNVIIGPNGSGKSNLLWVLELLSASASRNLDNFVIRNGGMASLLWDGRAPHIHFELEINSPTTPVQDQDEMWTYQLELSRIGNSASHRIDTELLANFEYVDPKGKTTPLKVLERTPEKLIIWGDDRQKLVRQGEDVPIGETIVSYSHGPFSLSRPATALRDALYSWRIYQDFRTDRQAPVRETPIARYEPGVSSDGHDLVSALHTLYASSRRFEEDIDRGMQAAFGDAYDRLVFPPSADGRVQLRLRWKTLQRESATSELSDGTLRFLYLLTLLANPSPPQLLAIDEPETGLHPRMMGIVAEYIANAALHSQVVVTTHSAEFLDALTPFRPTVTVASWENGETLLHPTSEKRLERWLQDYTLGSLYQSGELEYLGTLT